MVAAARFASVPVAIATGGDCSIDIMISNALGPRPVPLLTARAFLLAYLNNELYHASLCLPWSRVRCC